MLYSPTSAPDGTSLFILPNVRWENNYDTGFEINAVLGHMITDKWRVEGEFVYQRFNRQIGGDYDWLEIDPVAESILNSDFGNPIAHDDTPVDLYTLMANTIYDFKNSTQWTPFIGAGIGLSFIDSKGTKKTGTLRVEESNPPLDIEAPTLEQSPDLYGTAFAWQVKAGLNYDFRNNMSIGILYRLLGTTDFKVSKSKIITNPDISNEEAVFHIPEQDVDGMLNHSVNLSWTYKF